LLVIKSKESEYFKKYTELDDKMSSNHLKLNEFITMVSADIQIIKGEFEKNKNSNTALEFTFDSKIKSIAQRF